MRFPYADRHGNEIAHIGEHGRGALAGCPACKAVNRDSAYRRRRAAGMPERLVRTEAERLAQRRAKQRAASARYRATPHGREQIDRRSRKWYNEVIAYWIAQGIDLSCSYCDGPFAHIDHFMPRALGGSDAPENLRPSCAPCNWAKNDTHPDDWMALVAQRGAP